MTSVRGNSGDQARVLQKENPDFEGKTNRLPPYLSALVEDLNACPYQ